MSHRIWWLIAFAALGIGVVMEGEMQAPGRSEPPAATAAAGPAHPTVAARPSAERGG